MEKMQTSLEEKTAEFRVKLDAAERERRGLMESVRDGSASRQRHYTQMLEEARVAQEKTKAEAIGLKSQLEALQAEAARLRRDLVASEADVEVRNC